MHESFDEFEIWPDSTTYYGVSCPAYEKNPIDLYGENDVITFSRYFCLDPFNICR